jgi:hypothetical protein
MTDTPHSIERWARAVVALLDAEDDVRTTGEWSRRIGISLTQLREYCRLADVPAKSSLNLARLLRAIVHQEETAWPLKYTLNISDERTLSRMLQKANWITPTVSATAEDFIRAQRIATTPVAIESLLTCLSQWRKQRVNYSVGLADSSTQTAERASRKLPIDR